MKITATPLPDVSVDNYNRMRRVLDFTPAYQREGGVWSQETRSRLIDSIINGLDVPKLYFERATVRRTNETGRLIQYAVLDGKQRLEAIAEFLDGILPLPSDFRYYEDDEVKAKNFYYAELRDKYPRLAQRFLDFELPIISVTSDTVDLIEEMFQRLNASTALNSAERRNSVSGPTRKAVNELAEHKLLTNRSPIRSARYKYRELAAKFLVIEHQVNSNGRISDTKAATLLQFFLATKREPPQISQDELNSYLRAASGTLDRMSGVFQEDDILLSSIGTVVVYYIMFRDAAVPVNGETRAVLTRFEELRRQAARMSENDPEYARAASVRLRNYNILVQSTNDGGALTRRAEILTGFLAGYTPADELVGLERIGDSEDPSFLEMLESDGS